MCNTRRGLNTLITLLYNTNNDVPSGRPENREIVLWKYGRRTRRTLIINTGGADGRVPPHGTTEKYLGRVYNGHTSRSFTETISARLRRFYRTVRATTSRRVYTHITNAGRPVPNGFPFKVIIIVIIYTRVVRAAGGVFRSAARCYRFRRFINIIISRIAITYLPTGRRRNRHSSRETNSPSATAPVYCYQNPSPPNA